MGNPEPVEMDDAECDELLQRSATGVLSLSTPESEPPHAVPVSYGYDAVESVLYFRLAAGPNSEKGQLDGRAVTLTVYEEGRRHRSVVVQGQLEETTDEAIATETLAGLERVTIPLVDIFGEPPAEVTFAFYRLVPDRLTGRKETTTEP